MSTVACIVMQSKPIHEIVSAKLTELCFLVNIKIVSRLNQLICRGKKNISTEPMIIAALQEM